MEKRTPFDFEKMKKLVSSNFITEINEFEHNLLIIEFFKNFQSNLLTFNPKETTLTFESDVNSQVEHRAMYMNTFERDGRTNKLPVAISFGIRRMNYILCVEGLSLVPKEGELPETPAEKSEFIFYKRDSASEDQTRYATFESSVKRGFFLACSEDGRNLILKPHTEDKVDKTTTFLLKTISFQHTMRFKSDISEKIPYYIRNSHDDLLIAQPKEFIANFESDGASKDEQATFYMNIYREFAPSNGLPVIFSCRVNNKNYLLSVANNAVILKESELPNVIPTLHSEFIFHIIQFSSGHRTLRFESSLASGSSQQKFCLAWNRQDPQRKLMLKPFNEHGINEFMNFYLDEKESM